LADPGAEGRFGLEIKVSSYSARVSVVRLQDRCGLWFRLFRILLFVGGTVGCRVIAGGGSPVLSIGIGFVAGVEIDSELVSSGRRFRGRF